MGKLKRKVIGLLNRFQFIDLARAVGQAPSTRKEWLREYIAPTLKNVKFPSYRYFRAAVPTIYGVQRGLDVSPAVDWDRIEPELVKACKGTDTDKNVEVAKALFDLVRPRKYLAYDHQSRDLNLGAGRKAAIGLELYLIDKDIALFQYPYPRRHRLSDDEYRLMMSLIHFAYVRDDFEEAVVEVADLSCPVGYAGKKTKGVPFPRDPRIVRLESSQVLNRDELAAEVQNVHELLLEIGEEPYPS